MGVNFWIISMTMNNGKLYFDDHDLKDCQTYEKKLHEKHIMIFGLKYTKFEEVEGTKQIIKIVKKFKICIETVNKNDREAIKVCLSVNISGISYDSETIFKEQISKKIKKYISKNDDIIEQIANDAIGNKNNNDDNPIKKTFDSNHPNSLNNG
ncbi:hypothetical protein C1645_740510 [Glomus cerebriforme]|uniref:Uncharacterized protein n=1 Tax=Glomus cerebriforme TaxID=658196 RepID=A0A397SL45_9GLOM|nr:hypothetical protein C1645_740510 [Glomus cerebriforme]